MQFMESFVHLCAVVRVIVTELASLLGFLGLVAVGVSWEWNHLVALWKKR
jgi:hypothetical protein